MEVPKQIEVNDSWHGGDYDKTTHYTRTDIAQALADALEEYQFAEEIDDPALRQSELAVARQSARKALSDFKGE